MSPTTLLLDPTAETEPAKRKRRPRLDTLKGATIGLLDISKPRGDIFLNEIEALLIGRDLKVRRYQKPTFARPAPVELKQEISTHCDAVIEALAD
jgi:hypothetical protein